MEIRLSTTQKAPDALDNVDFDQNIGVSQALVYSGALDWPAPTVTAPPRPFELPIVFITPFQYDPSAGNLLLEVYNLSEVFILLYLLDLENAPDETSRVVEVTLRETGEHTIPPLGTGSRGLVTQFVYDTPEPGSAGAGLAFALAALRRGMRAT